MNDTPLERTKNPEKAKLAAADPKRPGEKCQAPAGSFMPVVNRGKCEGKADCVAVCPYGVFEVRRIDDADFENIGLLSKLKIRIHGMKSAYTPNADACRACGLCVVACPEGAIELVPSPGRATKTA